MEWLLLIFIFVLFIILRLSKCEITNPVLLFIGVWGVVILMYFLQKEAYYSLSTEAFLVLLLWIILFPLGYYLGVKNKITIRTGRSSQNYKSEYSLINFFFWGASLISVGILIKNDMIIIRNLVSGLSFYDMARLGIATEQINGIMSFAMIFVVYPFVTIASPICATEYFSNSQYKNRYLLLNCILVMLSVLDHGGRVQLINMAVCYVVAALLYGKKIKLSKKQKRWICGLLCVIGSVILALSFSRGIDDLWESVKLYLGSCIPHMTVRMEQYEFASQHTYGFLSLRGFIVPVVLVAEFLGVITNPGKFYLLAEDISVMIEDDVYIGATARTNAFLPASYYFYIDFGFWGVILGTIVYGAIVGYAYKKAKISQSKRSIAIYLLLLYGVVLSFIRFPFKTYQYAIGFLYLCLIYRRRKGVQLYEQ